MAKSIITKHYRRILTQWPPDLLRPEISFQKALHRRLNPPPTASPAENVGSDQATAMAPTKVAFDDEKGELEQINVLYSFLENRYMKQYPLSDKMMKPASNPRYYDELLKEMDEAPKRSWLQSVLNRWKGFLRFS